MTSERSPEELTAYVKRLEALAWQTVGSTEEYERLMEDPLLHYLTYVEALERLILDHAGGAD